jgi:Beta/Gamma crystallin
MNRIQSVFRSFKTVFVVMLLLGSASNAYAGDKDCWADFFEEPQYAGKHLLIEGPTQLENLNKVNGEDWNQRIHSIKIGSKARVTVYQNPRFELKISDMAMSPELMRSWGVTEQDIKEDSELIFTGKEMIHDLGDFNFHKKIRSLKVECM